MTQSIRFGLLLALLALAAPTFAAEAPATAPMPADPGRVPLPTADPGTAPSAMAGGEGAPPPMPGPGATPVPPAGAGVPPPATPIHGMVDVEFINPGDYSDINNGPFGYLRPPEVLAELNRYFVQLGEACLPAGTTLNVRVLNVRLAGVLAAERGHFRYPDARIMREAYWPSMRVDWQLQDAQGATLDGARETISDTNYLSRAGAYHRIEVQLPYEHTMLERWFGQRICRRAT